MEVLKTAIEGLFLAQQQANVYLTEETKRGDATDASVLQLKSCPMVCWADSDYVKLVLKDSLSAQAPAKHAHCLWRDPALLRLLEVCYCSRKQTFGIIVFCVLAKEPIGA